MRVRRLSLVLIAALAAACDDSPAAPSRAGIVAGAIVPANGGSVTTTGQLPGAFVVRGSGGISVPLTINSGRDLPFAELIVFLQDANGLDCASNSPDRPTWAPFRGSGRTSVSITGFQVGRLPCAVARIRVYLHTRNDSHLNTPPSANQIVAEATIPADFTIR